MIMSLGDVIGYHPFLDPCCAYLEELPRKIMRTTFFGPCYDFSIQTTFFSPCYDFSKDFNNIKRIHILFSKTLLLPFTFYFCNYC